MLPGMLAFLASDVGYLLRMKQDGMTRSIVFVDDEENLLSGLRRLLRHRRDEWGMRFASSGRAALTMLEERPADVIVSDMKMPEMDGAELLAAVRRLYPRTVRMIFSGHADRMSIISAVGPAQQFLGKPCDVEVLAEAIDRVLRIHDLIEDASLGELLGGVESLPKPLRIYEEMMAAAVDPHCRLEDVVRVIERDLATSADVLHLVNSPFFGLSSPVESVAKAVAVLGLETIQGLALAGAIFGTGSVLPHDVDYDEMSRRALDVATRCRRYAAADGGSKHAINDAFFAGLLCEVALPVLCAAHPDTWPAFAKDLLAADPPPDPWTQDRKTLSEFGFSLPRASAYLLGLWGFPEGVVGPISEQPAVLGSSTSTPAGELLTVARCRGGVRAGHLETGLAGYVTAQRLRLWGESVGDDVGAAAL
jgi:HD-like signal output (HDOD) protein/CheY-like chemotaxis protein